MTGGEVEIRPVDGRAAVRQWLSVQRTVFAGDRAWVPPLNVIERRRISPRHNPFFEFGEAQCFVAERGGRPVGRIAAHINRRHLSHHSDDTGFFGFFDCIDDRRVSIPLIDAASKWLAARGMRAMRGPFSLSINEEAGLLVDGFDRSPAMMMGHAPRWAGSLLEDAGLAKVMDLYAYRLAPRALPPNVERLAHFARSSPHIKVRRMEMSRYDEEVKLLLDIFNDAWSENWGFVPFSDNEIAVMARDLKPLMREKFVRFVEVDGIASAMIVVLPDLNRIIQPFQGRLLPFNWLRLASAVWLDKWTTARVPLMGVRKRHRGTPLAAAVLSLLTAEMMALGGSYDIDWIEFSWVLETNTAMTRLAGLIAGPPCRTYRVYEKPL